MKRLNSYISLIFLSGIILFVSACGTSEQFSDSTTEAGSLAFSLVWEEPPAPVIASSGNAVSALPGGCSGSGVDTVRVIIYNETGAELRSADFPCSDGEGTVDNIPPGVRKVVIHGLNTNSKILYRAEKSNVTIEAGKTTDLMTVTMNSAVPTDVNASAGSQSVTISWNNVQYATSYNIYWSQSPGVNKTNGSQISDITSSYTHTGLTNGTIYYYVVTAVYEDGEESGESAEVSAMPPRTWGTAEPIETNKGDANAPQIAMDSSGNAIAVWYQHDGTNNRIYANLYNVDKGWDPAPAKPIEINKEDANAPQIAMDANGDAIAVWTQFDGAYYNIYANRYVAGEGWDPTLAEPIEINKGDANAPQIAMDANGDAIVVWEHRDIMPNIWVNHYVAGRWGTARFITDNQGTNPQIAMDSNGNAIVVWRQYLGTIWIYANRYVVGESWNKDELVVLDSGGSYAPQIVMDANGNAIAVWEQYDADGITMSIYANRYVAGEGWDPTLAEPIEINRGDANAPQIVMDANGNAIAVWEQYDADGITMNIYANRYVAGTGWDDTARLIAADTGKASAPRIAMDSSGNAMVVWSRYDVTYNNIYANRYIAGQGWDDTAQLITTNEGNAYNPQITMNANGNAIAVWEQYDIDDLTVSIWANLFQ